MDRQRRSYAARLLGDALRRVPERRALVSAGTALSYAELCGWVLRTAALLRALPGERVRLRVDDHALQAVALLALCLTEKELDGGDAPVLQDADVQRALFAPPPEETLPAGAAPPSALFRDGDVFANLLPLTADAVFSAELVNALAVGGCVCFPEGRRGFFGELPRIEPQVLVLDAAGAAALEEGFEAYGQEEAGGRRLRLIFHTEPLPAKLRGALGARRIALERAEKRP